MTDRIGSEPLTAAEEHQVREWVAEDERRGVQNAMQSRALGNPAGSLTVARLLATLDAARSEPVPGLREAAQVVVDGAEPDDNFEGEFIDFLVPFEAIAALRAALEGAEK